MSKRSHSDNSDDEDSSSKKQVLTVPEVPEDEIVPSDAASRAEFAKFDAFVKAQIPEGLKKRPNRYPEVKEQHKEQHKRDAEFDEEYKNPSLSVERRVKDLLKRMTIKEKVAQVTGWWDPSEEKLLAEGKIFEPSFSKYNSPGLDSK